MFQESCICGEILNRAPLSKVELKKELFVAGLLPLFDEVFLFLLLENLAASGVSFCDQLLRDR